MRGGKADRRQARHVGNQRRARETRRDIVHPDGDEQGPQIVTLGRQPGKHEVRNGAHEGPDHHGSDQAKPGHRPAPGEHAGLAQAEPQIDVEGVQDVQDEVGQPVEADQRQNGSGQLAEADKEIQQRRAE